jgi:lysophospholipase L1-like esterase
LGAEPGEIAEPALNPTDRKRMERVFRLVAVTLPLLVLLLLELVLHAIGYGGNLDLFVPAPGKYSDYFMCNPEVARRYFTNQEAVPDPPNDLFLRRKPDDGYRIFVLGGSTTAGFPYGTNVMFSRILQRRLQDTFPERHVEVVNAAMTGVNSYTVLDLLDEILEQQADLILVYSGHNEFYGALGVASNETAGVFRGFMRGYLRLQRIRTFLLLRNVAASLGNRMASESADDAAGGRAGTLMQRIVREESIPLGSDLYRDGKKQFETNLRAILRKADAAGVPVVLSELVSNVRDLPPFVSVESEGIPRADTMYEQAVAHESAGDHAAARRAYVRAKDLDALRFRATEEFNEVIHKVAKEFDAPVVPMRRRFESASPNGLVGDNLMLEHLHPNVDGYFLMAHAFFETLRENALISSHWDPKRMKAPGYYSENWGYTELDEAFCGLRVHILKNNWPFQPSSAPARRLAGYRASTLAESVAVRIVQREITLERGHLELATRYEEAGDLTAAFEEYRAMVALAPLVAEYHVLAASMLIKSGQLDPAMPYLQDAIELEETAYAAKWIGQIHLNRSEIEQAILFLERAVRLDPEDAQATYNLSGAYALDQQFDRAREMLDRLGEIDPHHPGADDLRRQLDRI